MISRTTVKNLVLFAVSFFLCLAFCEWILRLLPPPVFQGVGSIRVPKAKFYGWVPVPNARQGFLNIDTGEVSYYRMNSQGWKDVEHQFKKPEGVVRILFLGDSCTWGFVPLEDIYTCQTERFLKERGFTNVEVISIGVGCWGTDQELEALVREGIRYRPDIVIYQFCENDFNGNLEPNQMTPQRSIMWHKPFRYQIQSGRLQKTAVKIPFLYKVKMELLKSELIYRLNMFRVQCVNFLKQKVTGEKYWWEKGLPRAPTAVSYGHRSFETFKHSPEAIWILEGLIAEMKAVCQRSGAAFAVFSEGDGQSMRGWLLKHGMIETDGFSDFVLWNKQKYPVDMKRPLRNLRRICKKHRIFLIEPKQDYDRYVNDSHTNRVGNLEMAQDLADSLTNWEPFRRCFEENNPD